MDNSNFFPYDNFVMKNMRRNGYYDMVKCLEGFVYDKGDKRVK